MLRQTSAGRTEFGLETIYGLLGTYFANPALIPLIMEAASRAGCDRVLSDLNAGQQLSGVRIETRLSPEPRRTPFRNKPGYPTAASGPPSTSGFHVATVLQEREQSARAVRPQPSEVYGTETMEAWDGLRALLVALQRDPRRPLRGYPDPHQRKVPPPYPIRLQAWAVDLASQIYRDYGTDVDLTVGFFHYPDRRSLRPSSIERPPPPVVSDELLPETILSASLDEPVAVPSGHTTSSTVRLHNHQRALEVVKTNGNVTARVLDPRSGAVVGGYDGAQNAPLVTFQIPPGESSTIPLLLGTASLVSDLGYAVPPGQWAFDVILELHSGRYRIPPMPVTVGP